MLFYSIQTKRTYSCSFATRFHESDSSKVDHESLTCYGAVNCVDWIRNDMPDDGVKEELVFRPPLVLKMKMENFQTRLDYRIDNPH